jgi:stalled ribosome alternative rescue factor ArfA
MVTVDKILDEITALDENSRTLLLDILFKRQIETRRKEIASNARKAKKEAANGNLTPMSASEIIQRLNK